MPHVTYAFLGSDERAARFAKKGTATDVTLYNAKQGERHINLVVPSRFPEKVFSLLYALDLADEVVLAPERIDRALGEMIVAAELLGKTHGFVRGGPSAALPELQALLAKTALRGLSPSDEPEGVLRERLAERAGSRPDGPLVVPVDHAFPVKGVGTVALALVRSGTLRHHQTLQAFPSTKMAEVRSLQIHDVDHEEAPGRARVGLALKGAEPDDVGRGRILAPAGSLKVQAPQAPFPVAADYHAFSKWTPRATAVLHLFHVMQDVVVRVEDAGDKSLILRSESPFAWVPDQPAVLVDVDNKAQRLVGRVRPK